MNHHIVMNDYKSTIDKCQIRTWINLSRRILKYESGVTIRAYALWSALRPEARTHFDRDELISFAMIQTGRTRQTVQSWIEAGIQAQFFVAGRDNQISLIGKLAVFKKYIPDQSPGAVVLVNTDDILTSKLQTVRARLFGSQFAKKSTWISRDKLQKISGPCRRTQLRYDKLNRQPKQFTFAINFVEAIQMPNIYSRSSLFNTLTKTSKKKQFGLHASNQNSSQHTNLDSRVGRCSDQSITDSKYALAECRVLFDDSQAAQDAASRRHNLGLVENDTFSIVEPKRKTRKARRWGHVFLEMHSHEFLPN